MQRKYTVHINDRIRLHPFSPTAPPSTPRGRFDPPPTPLMAPRTLPPTPVLHPGPLPEADTRSHQSVPGSSAGGAMTYHVGAGHTQSTLSPPGVPALNVSHPSQASDLCSTLRRFPLTWQVSQVRYADLQGLLGSAVLSSRAFLSGRRSCVLYFWPQSRVDGWHVRLGPFGDGKPITVHDILWYIDRELWRMVGAGFRRVDLFPGHLSFFLGLQEVVTADGDGYLVRLGPVVR